MSLKLLKSLFFKSAKIQEEIDREQKRVWPDTIRLLRLKKIRLSIKDRILKTMSLSKKRKFKFQTKSA